MTGFFAYVVFGEKHPTAKLDIIALQCYSQLEKLLLMQKA